ncbi:MAG: FkbM family methyltransferase [Puniceicoccales bacterium]|jgi:FkbM family methyltransferase|nr:FkbM family methyltransferase [Puniceicoccales bacterium]
MTAVTTMEKWCRVPNIPNSMGDFKRYLIENDMSLRLKNLKSGLDAASIAVIDRDVEFILNYPNEKTSFAEEFYCRDPYYLLTFDEKEQLAVEQQKLSFLQKKGTLGGPEVSVWEHGLKDLPSSVLNYIKGKSFVDAGAYIGDSALVLKKYGPSKIYCFEVEEENLKELQKNTKKDRDFIEIVPCALFSKRCRLSFRGMRAGSTSLSVPGDAEIEAIDLDSFCQDKKNVKIGLIKADIEGAEMDMLEGAKAIIIRDRPVLSLCIYHNPKQFFEMKPLLESWGLNYKFFIQKHVINCSIEETTLIAYPKELDESAA